MAGEHGARTSAFQLEDFLNGDYFYPAMTVCGEYAMVGGNIAVRAGKITMAGNILMWLISSALLLAYFWRVTLRKPFKTVGKHFLILLGVHLALSVGAMSLRQSGHFIPGEYRSAGILLIKGYMLAIVIVLVNFFAALSARGAAKMTDFHEKHNAANLHRQPLRFYLRHQAGIVSAYQCFFIAGGVFMLWAVCFRLGF